jgi:hypothetical protein
VVGEIGDSVRGGSIIAQENVIVIGKIGSKWNIRAKGVYVISSLVALDRLSSELRIELDRDAAQAALKGMMLAGSVGGYATVAANTIFIEGSVGKRANFMAESEMFCGSFGVSGKYTSDKKTGVISGGKVGADTKIIAREVYTGSVAPGSWLRGNTVTATTVGTKSTISRMGADSTVAVEQVARGSRITAGKGSIGVAPHSGAKTGGIRPDIKVR